MRLFCQVVIISDACCLLEIISMLMNHYLTSFISTLTETEPDALEKLLQWSDLILFDYLTGNYDRVASMLDGAEKEGRPAVLKETVHNLGLR